MAYEYTITRGPLTANTGTLTNGRLSLTPGNAVPVGTVLVGTGRTHGVWVEAKTPWQVKNSGTSWFHRDYITAKTATTAAPTITDVLRGWIADVEGKALDVDGRHGVQCVDGAKDWARAVSGRDPARAIGNGKDVAGTLIAEGWQDVNRALARPGDVVSFGKPYGKSTRTGIYYGHVGVVLSAPTGGRVTVMDQDGFRDSVMHRSVFPIEHVTRAARPPRLVPSSGAAQPTTHTIAAGDTLWGLTRRYGVSLGALMELNPGIQADNLRVGQKVVVAR